MNNKGFAISGILYGVMILFLSVLLSILHILVTRINNLTEIIDEVSASVEDNGYTTNIEKNENDNDTQFLTKVRGKYEIKINDNNVCYSYLPKNIFLVVHNGILKYIEAENGKINISNVSNNTPNITLTGNNCLNSGITKFAITKIYSSIYNE